MIPTDDELTDDRGEELAALILTLHDTQQRILELTGSAIDAVLHPSGQHYLMRAAQDDLRESVLIERRHAAERAAILDALPARVALLDDEGYILIVNAAWRDFARANGWSGQDCGIGRDYRDVCARTLGDEDARASAGGAGIAAVLTGESREFSIEYPFRAGGRERWFRMTVTPVQGGSGGAVVMHVDVTQRREAEKERDRANRLLRIAARASRMGGWSVDLATDRADWSDEVCAIHGMPPGANPSVDEGIAFYAPESRGRIREAFGACAREGIPFDEELEIVTAQGVRKWVRAIGEPVRNPDGAIVGVNGAFQDLTPIKEAEAAALLGERRFHQLAETLPQIVWTAEPDGTVDFISADFYRQTRLERLDSAAWEWLEALHPDDRNRALQSWEDSRARGAEHRVEFRIWDAEQQDYRWHVITARPVRDAGGAIVKWYGAAIDIHDRRLAEEALTEAQQRNRLILAAAGEGIAGVDAEGRVVFENPAAWRMLGYEAAEMVGRHFHWLAHHHHADGREYPLEACPIHRTLEDGQTRRAEDELLFRKDGSSFPAALTCAPTIDEATGAITGAVILFRDVTEERRDRGLREMEARVLDMISAGRPLSDVLNEITLGADSLLPGVTSSVLLAGTDGRLRLGAAPGLPASLAALADGLAIGPKAGSAGTAAHRREPVIVSDILTDPLWEDCREYLWASGLRACWSMPVLASEGAVLATFSFYHREPRAAGESDRALMGRIAQFLRVAIERTRQNESLRTSEERFGIVARATTDVVWDWDIRNDHVWWSDGMLAQFGHDPADFTQGEQPWAAWIHAADRGRVLGSLRSLVADPQATDWQCEYRFGRPDGTEALVRDRGHVIRDAEGNSLRMVGSLVDVTEQRALEEQLHQSQRLDALGRLTGGIAHDFNNLLTVILGNAELLTERLESDPEARQMAETTRAMAERAADLTLRLLAFARSQPLATRPTDVAALLGDMEELLRRTLGEQVKIRLECARDLWPALVDPVQLENAILNLGINARDAMPEGGTLTIAAANGEPGEAEADGRARVVITVSDTGHGMTPEVAGRAFDPFFTTKPGGKGSGLGLSMVFGFVKQSGGHITLRSEPGRGTTFDLCLPRAEIAPPAPVAETARHAVSSRGERVLFVEDNEVVRQHVVGLLRGLGYAVTSVASAEEALAALEGGGPFDLVFTDVVLAGGMSGPQLAEKARTIEPGLPVLFTSGYAEAGPDEGPLEPAAPLLSKPFRKEDLAARLRQALDGARGAREV